MTVKEWKEIFASSDDEKNVIIRSPSGMEWKLNKKVEENPKKEDKQIIIYIV